MPYWLSSNQPTSLWAGLSCLTPSPLEAQEAFQFLPATAMHEGGNPRLGKFELLNLAGGFPAKRTLLVTAISRCQKTTHPQKPAIKLLTMELAKLTKSLFSRRQGRYHETRERPRKARNAFVAFGSYASNSAA